MAVRIRMKKLGRKQRPFFRICAMDQRAPRDGRVIEELGTYDPMVPETDARAILNADRIDYWLSVGAQPSQKVSVLIRKYGTGGTHLDAQQSAIERLSARRAKAIEQARAAAASVEMPKPEEPAPPAAETPAEESAEAKADDSAAPADGAEATAESDADAGAEAKEAEGESKDEESAG